ncbi:hypothetical protein HS088_TW16G00570 [Tripterygium wilfordii]|uniref:S phase cyclin A-associated protein in the endoplasmic reticulum N-terminal domain-containing protein n=1 Tax=Tripterygium wilfordii TaxID=458696 RepID=A0A7J7CJ83_TRIWF|nr:uncharacterized protein LOC119980854 [Tripterygium wilfordii]KAF5734128.1 hypothetical protein HS088_TW16G00570 [Tripterygium wilfordii]
MDSDAEALDDQGSGWLEVKKKHRSSSKFSVQNWVGGISGRSSSTSQCSQPFINEKGGSLPDKRRSQCPKGGRIFSAHESGRVTNSDPVSNDSGKGFCSPDKAVVEQDIKSPSQPQSHVMIPNGKDSGAQEIPQKNMPHLVHKIKWGDLEDDMLEMYKDNKRADIKFGDNNLAVSMKDEITGNVHVSSSNNLEEKGLAGTSLDINGCLSELASKNEIVENNCKEVNEVSSEHLDVSLAHEKMINVDTNISNCKHLHSENIESTKSGENAGLMKLQVPFVVSEVGKTQSLEGPYAIGDSSTAMTVEHGETLWEKGEPVTPNEAASVGNSGVQHAAVAHNDESETQITNPIGEVDTSESKERFRQRLWCFLFENLNRAVDELYLLCELECDVEQMKEAIIVLDEAASDFKELITRVKEFEKVKRTVSQSIDELPITLKADHRRPHSLSWEVRRMTTSPHKAEILSSSLEAFKKIQQERASLKITNDAKALVLACSSGHQISADHLKSTDTMDVIPNVTFLRTESHKQSGSIHLTQGNLTGERPNTKSGKLSCDQQSSAFSNVNLSKSPLKDDSATYGVGKSKREHVSSVIAEKEKLITKKDKIHTEKTTEKILKSTDHLRRQIPFPEKDKGRINSTLWKSLDAWKEKRNWEDILSSPFRVSSRLSHSPGMGRKSSERARTLRDKLMSPEKKKKTALDLKKEAEERHARALKIRSELENERVQKLQRTSEKLNRVNEWQAVRSMKLREGMYARHQRSESRHEAYLAQVVRRAGDESSKVNEVRFITSLNEENKKLMLRQKLHDSKLRRAEKLQVMKTKQKEDMAREEAVSERRKLIEAEKLQRIADMQRKKEEAQVRREEERKASSAAREAKTIEQLRRKEERARAQQEEAELLAQKLAERLSESEQRRKFYLEQIRERASMDFRDQSSPLVRRFLNKEGQGRLTPTNNGEEYQANGITGAGESSLATGSATLQHSLKRRIKRIRQRLMALKYEYPEIGVENTGIGYRTALGAARAKIGKWLQELQRLRQARKEGAASIGLIIAEMIKFLEGKDPELQASRQAGLIDFIASALPASHTSKPGGWQVTIHLLKLLRVVLSSPANRSYFLAQNLLPPIIPMLSAALENYIKIAASLNVPGSTSLPLGKTSIENFESISEVLDGFLWTVTTIIGHVRSDQRQLVMRENLVELVIAYQVIHRLRDLFALYDRPQVEGSPFPSSILLGIYLLVVLTSRCGGNSPIDWESSPMKQLLQNQSSDAKLAEFADTRDCGTQHSVKNDGMVICAPDSSDGKAYYKSLDMSETNEVVAVGNSGERNSTKSSIELNNTVDRSNLPDESQNRLVEENGKHAVHIESKQTNDPPMTLKQPAAFLLSAVSETGLVSLLSLLTAVLLQANNKSSEQASCILPSNFEEVATGVLKVLNNLALWDITFIQRTLARPDLKMEFFHLMSFLLSHCTSKWKVATDQVGFLMLESLLLLGHFALFHPENQAVLRWGKSPTILHKVCDLPFVFFSDPDLMPVLAGTLVAACYRCEQNKGVVQQELNVDMLLSLLKSCRNVLPEGRSNPTPENLPADDSGEFHQYGSESRKSQGDTPLRCSRHNARGTRVSLGKGTPLGNTLKTGKIRSQRESKAAKTCDEMTLNSLVASETSTMLHFRFPCSFIDTAEQFFSFEISDSGKVI